MNNLNSKLAVALKKHSSSLHVNGMNTEYVVREAKECIGIAESLRSYRGFLINAQRMKKRTTGLSTSFTNEVIQQSYHATKEGYRFLSQALKLVKHFKHSDGFEKKLNSWKKVLEDVGPSNLKDLWQFVLNNKGSKDAIDKTGLSQSSIDELSKVIEENNALISVKDGDIIMEDKITGRKFKVLTAAESSTEQSKNIFSLLSANRLDMMAEAIDLPALVNVYGVSSDRGQNLARVESKVEAIDPYKSILTAALVVKTELNREFKQMEHTGIPAFKGEGEILGILVVGILLTILGVAIYNFCSEHEKTCWAIAIGIFIALFLMGKANMCIEDENGDRVCTDIDGNTTGTGANPGDIPSD